MSNVHRLPVPSALVSKKQLAEHLGRSTRWIELRVNEGLPSANLDRYGRRMFNIADVEAWLRAGRPRATSVTERLARMETEMDALRAKIKQLENERRAS